MMGKNKTILMLILISCGIVFIGAISLTSNSVSPHGFLVNGWSADWSGGETIQAAVTGKSIYVEKIYITSEVAGSFIIGEGDAVSGVTTELLGPVYIPINGFVAYEFTRPLKITENVELAIDGSSGVTATVTVQGYIK